MNTTRQKEEFGNKGFTVTGWEECLSHLYDSPATPAVEDAANTPSRSYSKYTPPPSTTAPIAFLFSHPFSSCHSKCYSQLVKVHYTLSSWPEIYTPQHLCRAGEGCNPLRLMTVHVSWRKWWIFWLSSMWINMIEYYYTELTLRAVILKSDVFAEKPHLTHLPSTSKEAGQRETDIL